MFQVFSNLWIIVPLGQTLPWSFPDLDDKKESSNVIAAFSKSISIQTLHRYKANYFFCPILALVWNEDERVFFLDTWTHVRERGIHLDKRGSYKNLLLLFFFSLGSSLSSLPLFPLDCNKSFIVVNDAK